ncbi:MAG: N-acetyl-gamma-glutamyl-phosphate reductase [Geminicoccaceae bacterium]|nr:N-acetyl-gamma-glutamyl-phosphate reductase [Geminicoccaceae bacterium]MCX7628718.1 N-acetyl-gamma-glutamyl-phosphate reductase [Geminicoccaceae bacterium]
MRARVFIDGEAGTTGLGIRERLAPLEAIELVAVDPARRKDPEAKRALLATVDVAVLCLPDEAARETVALAAELGERSPRILDASTAHRTAPGWVYGLPELAPGQREAIARARRVANPGCYPTGAILLLRPLVDAGLLPPDFPLAINAVSGYSGGGRSMIEAYERGSAPPFELYALGLEHKHLPEIEKWARLERRPIFVPSVGNFRQGMLVCVPLHLDALPMRPRARDLEAVLAERYRGERFVRVMPTSSSDQRIERLDATALAGRDEVELFVFGNEARRQAVLVARLDNLGKGASGAAVQNLYLMLGLETSGDSS